MSARLLLAAALGLLAAATLASFLGELAWWLDLFSHLRLHYAVAGLVLAVAALALGRRRLALVAAVVLALNLAAIAPYLSLFPARSAPAGLELVFLNLMKGNQRIDSVLGFLRRADADVVVLAEVTPRWAKALESIADLYPHRLECTRTRRCDVALLAKRPWEDAGFKHLAEIDMSAVWARFRWDGRRFTVLGTHLNWPLTALEAGWQRREVEELAALRRRLPGPLVLAGDFNSTPWSALFARLVAATGLSRAGRLPLTWPAWLPWLRLPIDHVLVDPAFTSATVRTGPSVGSDHLPLIARLGFAE